MSNYKVKKKINNGNEEYVLYCDNEVKVISNDITRIISDLLKKGYKVDFDHGEMKILVTDYEADLSVKGNLEFYKKEYEEVQRVIEDSIDNGDYSKVGFYTNVSEYLKFRIRKSEEFLERYMS